MQNFWSRKLYYFKVRAQRNDKVVCHFRTLCFQHYDTSRHVPPPTQPVRMPGTHRPPAQRRCRCCLCLEGPRHARRTDAIPPSLPPSQDGFYYHGAMGKIIYAFAVLFRLVGLAGSVKRLCEANTLEEQIAVWEGSYIIRFCRHAPRLLVWFLHVLTSLVFMNPLVLWFGAGVPAAQAALITRDKLHILDYMVRILDGLAHGTSMKHENYFFLAVLQGRFTRECCPRYLQEGEYERLKVGAGGGGGVLKE